MDADSFFLALFVFVPLFSIIGGVVGYFRGRAAEGAAWGFILGPVGVGIVLMRDDARPKCSACLKPIAEGATRCPHCCADQPKPAVAKHPPAVRGNVLAAIFAGFGLFFTVPYVFVCFALGYPLPAMGFLSLSLLLIAIVLRPFLLRTPTSNRHMQASAAATRMANKIPRLESGPPSMPPAVPTGSQLAKPLSSREAKVAFDDAISEALGKNKTDT